MKAKKKKNYFISYYRIHLMNSLRSSSVSKVTAAATDVGQFSQMSRCAANISLNLSPPEPPHLPTPMISLPLIEINKFVALQLKRS